MAARVAPPPYSGQSATLIEEPSEVRALVGSSVTLQGRGDAAGIVAHRDADSLVATRDNDRWSIRVMVDPRPSVLRISDRQFERLLAIAPVMDNAPAVTLAAPASGAGSST